MGESTWWCGLDQPLSESELAWTLLSIHVIQMSSDMTVISPTATRGSREVKCKEISQEIMTNPDEEIMIATDAVGGELDSKWF